MAAAIDLLCHELGLSLVEGGWIASAFNSLLLLLPGGGLALSAHGLGMLLCLLLSFCGGAVPPAARFSAHGLSHDPVQLAVLQGYFVQLTNLGQLLGPLLLAAIVAGSTDWSVALSLFLAGVMLAAIQFAMRPRSY